VVVGVLVGSERDELVTTTDPLQVLLGPLVGREQTRRRAQLCSHVGDSHALGCTERLDPGTCVLEDPAHATLYREPTQHPEDDVLRSGPARQFTLQSDLDDLWHLDVVGSTPHRDGDVETARPDGELSDAARCGGVRVRAEQRLSRCGEVLAVDVVTDTVSRPGEVRPVGACRGPQKPVVVGVLKVELVGLVVAVLCRELGLDLVEAECFELEPD
jgi:hypothetical protein